MASAKLNAVLCNFTRGGFSGEVVFRVPLVEGDSYIGAASRVYCFSRRGQRLEESQPAAGKPIDGKLLAQLIDEEADRLHFYLPDGAVVMVARDQATEVKEVTPDVPVQP